MSKLENWGDLFKYNKELNEDDYNHGQGIVIKTKSKANDAVTVSESFKYTHRSERDSKGND
jgi:hypothetical protein